MLSYRKAMHNRLRLLKNFGCYEIITVIKLTEEFDAINGKILVKHTCHNIKVNFLKSLLSLEPDFTLVLIHIKPYQRQFSD